MSKTVKERVLIDLQAALYVILTDICHRDEHELPPNYDIYTLMLIALFKHIHPATINKQPSTIEILDIFNNAESPTDEIYEYFECCLGNNDIPAKEL